MTRTLRGAWARRWTLLPLLLLTVIVVSGTVAVVTFAQAAGTSASLAVPLLVLGLVAVPATARELAEARRGELGLARLRGVQGGQLSALAALEPLLVLVVGGVAGLLLGGLAGRVALDVLAPAVPPGALTAPGPRALLAGLAIVVVGLVAVVVGMGRTLAEPLADQVRSARRPRAAGPVALALGVLVVVAAAVATYRASVAGGEPDLLVLAAPALVGLAVGLLVVGGLQALARLLVRPSRHRGTATWLAVRRLARVADVAAPLRLVVAAATVATVALTGATQVDAWTDETARLQAGGPVRVGVDDGSAATALRLTSDLDPDGRWLMAAVVVPGTGSVPARRAYLDLTRYDAVLGDFYADTPVVAAEPAMHDLVQVSGRDAGGGTVTVGVSGVSDRLDGPLAVRVVVTWLDEDGDERDATLTTDVPASGSGVGVSTDLVGCPCTIASVAVTRLESSTSTRPVVLDQLDLGGLDALDLRWQGTGSGSGGQGVAIQQVDGGLLVPDSPRELEAVPTTTAGLPVIATASATWDGPPVAETPGGDDRTAVLVGRAAALPLVEADGLLLDLATAQAGAAPTVPAAEVSVVAAADTPPDLLAALEQAAGGRATTLQQVRDDLVVATGATQAAVYAVMALACLLIALLALVTAFARQRAAWRRDLAALRVVGTPRSALAGAARVEVALLALAAAVGSVVGGLLAVRLLLSHLALVDVPEHAVTLVTAVAPGPTALAGAAAALVVAVSVGWARSVAGRRSRPATLREEGSA